MSNKRDKVIELIKDRLDSPDKEELVEQAAEKALDTVHKKYVQEVKVPPEVIVEGLSDQIAKALNEGVEMKADITNELLKAEIEGKTEVEGTVDIGNEIVGEMKVANPEDVKQPDSSGAIVSFISGIFTQLIDLLGKLQRRTFNVQPTEESFKTPQKTVIVDPDTGDPIKPGEFAGQGQGQGGVTSAHASAPSKTGIRGSNKIGTGSSTVSTAGTRVQLPDQTIDRVYVQAAPGNSGEVVIGGSDVVADTANREGLALYGSQWQFFTPKNLNKLYIDATQDGDKINYIYEYDD